MTADSDVRLRDHLETLIAMHVERIEQRFEALNKALELQATEYERRLEDLNHERRRELEERQRTLPRETWEQFKEGDYDPFKHATNTKLQKLETRGTTWIAAGSLMILAIGLVVSIAIWLRG